jgi:hypothetical protein
MPTVGVTRDELFEKLGENYGSKPNTLCPEGNFLVLQRISKFIWFLAADEAFDKLCFEYGIELDDVVCIILLNI